MVHYGSPGNTMVHLVTLVHLVTGHSGLLLMSSSESLEILCLSGLQAHLSHNSIGLYNPLPESTISLDLNARGSYFVSMHDAY